MKPLQTLATAIIIMLLLVYGFGSVLTGSMNPAEWSGIIRSGDEPPPAAVLDAAGIYSMKTQGYDSLDMSTSYDEGTDYDSYWFRSSGAGWMSLGSGEKQIEVTQQDNGYIWVVVKAHSGQDLYVDAVKTKAQNPRISEVRFDDIDDDGYKEFAFRFSMMDIPKTIGAVPEVYVYPYLLAYEAPTINTADDIDGIGTAASQKFIEWYVTFATTRKGYALTKVEFEINTTDTTKIQLNRMNIPAVGYKTGDQFGVPLRGTGTLTWTYTIGSNLQTAAYILYGANMLNKFDFTTQLTCNLASGDVITATINIYALDPTGAQVAVITDTIILEEASSG